ncbi:glutamate--tRNA ligase, partial [Candidatus Bathyarchaeota archaeon]|nr:glutamate--tRNA ligase [Candidatus Bathyarchaeota archaeon]
KRPVLEFYDRIRDDLTWLGCDVDQEYIQSDRIPIYYDYAKRLLKKGDAYVCTCQPETFRRKVLSNDPCACRGLPSETNLERWIKMLNGEYAEGEAVVRVKTDLNHPNPAVRDWPALRIVDTVKYPHPRVGSKYRVWPLYNMAAGVDDHLMGVTHIIRGKEHLTNKVRQEYLYNHLGWAYPESIHYGRLKITGTFLSKSKIVEGVREGLYKGWDDPRLATFAALRRRGITSEAIKLMIIDVGPKKIDVVLSWDNLYAHNRKLLDPLCNRYFFVSEPVKLSVTNVPRVFNAKLPLHPEKPERGFREYTIRPHGEDGLTALWVSRNDLNTAGAKEMIRLMDLFNVKIERKDVAQAEASFSSVSYKKARATRSRLIHWIPVGDDLPCQIVMPDATLRNGVAESSCRKLTPKTIIQFQRFGFVRIDNVEKKIIAYYAHK